MKKTIIVMLALFLALPAISFAGSATSRWDMTIGGYVKFDMGYSTGGNGQDAVNATVARTGYGAYGNINDKYGNFFSYAGESRLNFLVRGPDAWGAKTSAFIEGHFRGNEYSGSTASAGAATSNAGTFGLRHAFMQFDWPTSKLLIGQTWQKWGILPTFANTLLDYNNLGPFLKGMRQPLVRFEQTIAKNWTWALGIISPTNTLGSNNTSYNGTGMVDSYTRSTMPFWEGSFGFTSDKCGNIGPWQMLFALEGFYGRQKLINGLDATYGAGNTGTYNVWFKDQDVDSWGISFKGFIPIIPEKKGNKKGALSLSGVLFYSQNPGMFQAPTTVGSGNSSYSSYWNSGANTVTTFSGSQLNQLEYSAPVQFGGWGQVSYFLTDKLFVNGWYGYTATQVSDAWRTSICTAAGTCSALASGASTNGNQVVGATQIIANIMYDVNAAIRMGFEYSWYKTTWANYDYAATGAIVGGKDGTTSVYRVGAYYFF